jgi:hypothetical protein
VAPGRDLLPCCPEPRRGWVEPSRARGGWVAQQPTRCSGSGMVGRGIGCGFGYFGKGRFWKARGRGMGIKRRGRGPELARRERDGGGKGRDRGRCLAGGASRWSE